MSRSYRKTPIFGHTTATSEKSDKIIYNKRIRRKNKLTLHHALVSDTIDSHYAVGKEIVDTWSLDKDGKSYRPNATKLDMVK